MFPLQEGPGILLQFGDFDVFSPVKCLQCHLWDGWFGMVGWLVGMVGLGWLIKGSSNPQCFLSRMLRRFWQNEEQVGSILRMWESWMKYLRACFLFKKALGYFFSLAILMSLVQSSVSKFGDFDVFSPVKCHLWDGWFGMVGWLVGWLGWLVWDGWLKVPATPNASCQEC